MKKALLVLLAGLAGALALPAAAQSDLGTFYVGASIGRSHWTDVCNNVAGDCKPRDTDYSGFGGLQFNRYLAVEAGARAFGHAALPGGNVKASAYDLDGVVTLPLLAKFSLLGRVGIFHAEMKGENIATRKNGGTFGWGAQYDTSPQFALRLEWQRYPNLGGGDFGATTNIDSLHLAALIRFR
jgi:opacity protein-like surface antigen